MSDNPADRSSRKLVHDLLLAMKPGEAEHNAATCIDCTPGIASTTAQEAQTVSQQTAAPAAQMSPAEIQAVAAKAAADLMEAAEEKRKAEEAVATKDRTITELEGQVSALTTAKDAETARANTAEQRYTDVVAFLTDEADKATAAATAAATAEATTKTRVEEVKAIAAEAKVILFTDEQLTEKGVAWAALSDEAWTAQAAEYKDLAARLAKAGPAIDPLAQRTGAFTATAGASDVGTGGKKTGLEGLTAARRAGVDPTRARTHA